MAIEVIGTIKPKNNGSFPVVEAKDVSVDDKGTRLSEKLSNAEVFVVGAVLEKVSDDTHTVIQFTINGTIYEAESGMKWGEWVNSEYNTIGCGISGNTIMYGDNDPITLSGTNVASENTIQAGASYKSASYSPPITFTIDGTTYEATSGMKWGAWVASAYNTAEYVMDSTYKVIQPKNNPSVAVYNGDVAVTDSDLIISGKEYQVLSY